MAAPPKVSIITVTYNAAAVLEPTIESILAQTFTDYEYLIIDGGSKDGTPDIIRRLRRPAELLGVGARPRPLRRHEQGPAGRPGEYVWFMNAGDRLYEADTLRKGVRGRPRRGRRVLRRRPFLRGRRPGSGPPEPGNAAPTARTADLAVAAVRHGGVSPVVRAPPAHCPALRPVAPLQRRRGLGNPLPARGPAGR
jgi:hypothetical protein